MQALDCVCHGPPSSPQFFQVDSFLLPHRLRSFKRKRFVQGRGFRYVSVQGKAHFSFPCCSRVDIEHHTETLLYRHLTVPSFKVFFSEYMEGTTI